VAGLSVAALILAYEWFLRTHVSQTPVEIVRFSLGQLEPSRVEVMVGLIALNASVVGLATLLYRLAWSPWVFPSVPRLWRVRAVFLWLLPAVMFFGVYAANDTAPQWPSVLVAASAAIAAWLMHRYRFISRHGSQAIKLLLSFLAVALPSIILYPSLV